MNTITMILRGTERPVYHIADDTLAAAVCARLNDEARYQGHAPETLRYELRVT